MYASRMEPMRQSRLHGPGGRRRHAARTGYESQFRIEPPSRAEKAGRQSRFARTIVCDSIVPHYDAMAKSDSSIKRSREMVIVAYYLSKYCEGPSGSASTPPQALGVGTWKSAYAMFFDALGAGRTISSFFNSMKNARDTFDALFENGRVGWSLESTSTATLLPRLFDQVHQEWSNRDREELEVFVRDVVDSVPMSDVEDDSELRLARSEGGQRVVVSVRPERDPRLRRAAISIHGLDCMACGFNFGRVYGEIGRDYVEVHHVVQLAKPKVERTPTDPKKDLIVLCANCHRVVHRRRSVCLTLDELKGHIQHEKGRGSDVHV